MAFRRRRPHPEAARILSALEESVLGTGELPERPRLTLDEWNSLSPEERQRHYDVGIRAIERVGDVRGWAARIRELGGARHQPAVPLLVRLWKVCPVTLVQVAAAHALFEMESAEARDVLRAGIDDHDSFGRFMALKVAFTDPGPAWEALSWLFAPERLASPSGVAVAYDALAFLSPSSLSSEGPGWNVDALQTLLAQDRRWLDLCVALRTHGDLGVVARRALRSAEPAITKPALDEAARTAAAAARHRTPSPRLPEGLLARYERGDHRSVWQTLRDAGRLDADARSVADSVASATMTRVRRNAERLVAALVSGGWPIHPDRALTAPPPDLDERLATLERLSGAPVPPAIAAFWRIVGGINLVPDHDEPMPSGVPADLVLLDPLEVDDPVAVWFEVEEWLEHRQGAHPELAGPIEVPVAPDELHKANMSGGAAYAIWLPDHGADPLVREESHRLCLTDYLRLAFDNSGFTRLRDESDHADAVRWVDALDVELDPF